MYYFMFKLRLVILYFNGYIGEAACLGILSNKKVSVDFTIGYFCKAL